MTAYTDDYVATVIHVVRDHGHPLSQDAARAVLDAVAPAIAARERVAIAARTAEAVASYVEHHDAAIAARALRDAADEWTDDSPMATGVAAWLRARAEQVNP